MTAKRAAAVPAVQPGKLDFRLVNGPLHEKALVNRAVEKGEEVELVVLGEVVLKG